MSVTGIIAEFNPFHRGHAYILEQAKQTSEAVVVAMSGNFVQRGEPALLSDRYRTKMALLHGADLVLQLPMPYAMASAGTFARGGVSLLSQTDLVDSLLFGSECGELSELQTAAQAVHAPKTAERTQALCKQGYAYPMARQKAVEQVLGAQTATLLQSPNDILAVEYLAALAQYAPQMQPIAVKRQGIQHDAKDVVGAFASASYLRALCRAGASVEDFLPPTAFEVLRAAMQAGHAPAQYAQLEPAILAFWRTVQPETLLDVPDADLGLLKRLKASAKTATTLTELFDTAKTKCYTHARIRRVVLAAFLGLSTELTKGKVPYIRVLGANAVGIELLKQLEGSAKVPVLKRASDAKVLTGRAKKLFAAECLATDIYNLTLPKIRPCGTELQDAMCIMQDF